MKTAAWSRFKLSSFQLTIYKVVPVRGHTRTPVINWKVSVGFSTKGFLISVIVIYKYLIGHIKSALFDTFYFAVELRFWSITFEITFWFRRFIFSHCKILTIYTNNFSSLDFIDQGAHDSHPFNGITRCEDLSLSEDDSPSSHYEMPIRFKILFENFDGRIRSFVTRCWWQIQHGESLVTVTNIDWTRNIQGKVGLTLSDLLY